MSGAWTEKTRLAYGLAAIAATIGGGVAMFYKSTPGIGVDAPTMAELYEAVNERRAAALALPFTVGEESNAWSFAAFTNMGLDVVWAGRPHVQGNPDDTQPRISNGVLGIIYRIEQLADSGLFFDDTLTNAYTFSNLHVAAGIGRTNDQKWTVAYNRNGAVYSSFADLWTNNALPTMVWTGLLWECYRALALLTNTQVMPYWTNGLAFRWETNGTKSASVSGEGLKTNDPPSWWTNLNALPDFLAANEIKPPPGAADGSLYTNATSTAGPLTETLDMRGWSGAIGTRANRDVDTYSYFAETPGVSPLWVSEANLSTGMIALPRLSSGVVATVRYAIAQSGVYHRATRSGGYGGVDSTNFGFSITNFFTNAVFSVGLSTSIWHEAVIPEKTNLLDFVDWRNDTAHGRWESRSSWTNEPFITPTNEPQPRMYGHLATWFPLRATISWQFLRATNTTHLPTP